MTKKINISTYKTKTTTTIIDNTKVDVKRSYLKYDLTHLQHEPLHCLAKGLFRSLGPDDRHKLKLATTYQFGNGNQIEFSGPEPLGADDLRVLQALIALAPICDEENKKGYTIKQETKSELGKTLREKLELKGDAMQKTVMMVKTSYRKIAQIIGYAESTNNYIAIQKSIERMQKVNIIVQKGNIRMGFNLLSSYISQTPDNKQSGKVCIALNPMVSDTILGKEHYVRINVDETRAIQSDPACLIHQHLCAMIDFGMAKRFNIDTLCEYVWPDQTEKNGTIRKRRFMIRKALEELIKLGWEIKEYMKDKYEIKRPKPEITVKQKKVKKKAKEKEK